MKKVLVFGANGMAGHMITLYLEETNKYEVFNVCHMNPLNKNSLMCDVFDIDKLTSILNEIKPDVIINCIGILNDKSDYDVAKTSYINTFFPKWLENHYRETNCKIIHLSTDCVFSGGKGDYTELDDKDDESMYGLTKNFGEIDNNKDLTIRTSIIGPELKSGKGLFDWFMRQKGETNGYVNVYWSGITTLELARIIDESIQDDICGLFNVACTTKITKYDLLQLISGVFDRKDVTIKSTYVNQSDKSLKSIRADYKYKINDYETMIKELKKWMEQHMEIYYTYFSIVPKDKVIIVWSKFKTDKFSNEEEIEEWIKHRLKVFMTYTCEGFKRQTNQNFIYLINYDEKAKKYILEELKKYPPLPDNIIFTEHYHREIKKIIWQYKYLYLVRIDSDDMYCKEFIQKLISFKPKEETKVLIAQSGYIYDVHNGDLAKWFYKSPPFYTLIYNSIDFMNGYRHEVHGHSSVINLPNELIDGDNFVVIIHGKNTVSRFSSSFQKGFIDDLDQKQKIIDDFNLKLME